jgi:hypothetical protein
VSSYNFKDKNVIVDHVQYEQVVECREIIEVVSNDDKVVQISPQEVMCMCADLEVATMQLGPEFYFDISHSLQQLCGELGRMV